jgi:hypothetical protein
MFFFHVNFHWWSLIKKISCFVTRKHPAYTPQSHSTNRNNIICILPLKEAKSSRSGIIAWSYHRHFRKKNLLMLNMPQVSQLRSSITAVILCLSIRLFNCPVVCLAARPPICLFLSVCLHLYIHPWLYPWPSAFLSVCALRYERGAV